MKNHVKQPLNKVTENESCHVNREFDLLFYRMSRVRANVLYLDFREETTKNRN
jgi:hypothetical protein